MEHISDILVSFGFSKKFLEQRLQKFDGVSIQNLWVLNNSLNTSFLVLVESESKDEVEIVLIIRKSPPKFAAYETFSEGDVLLTTK